MRYKDALMPYPFSKLLKLRFVSEMIQVFRFQSGNVEHTSKLVFCKIFHILCYKVQFPPLYFNQPDVFQWNFWLRIKHHSKKTMKSSPDNLIIWINTFFTLITKRLFRTWILSYCFMRFLGPSNNYDRHILKDKIFRK